jgi:hypothetical protein
VSVLALTLLALALLAPVARASVSCRQSANGVLRITPYASPKIHPDPADATVRRQGERVLVLADPFDDAGEAVHCTGATPTVANTKRIVFLQSGLSSGELELTGGLPAPRIEFHAARGSLAYGVGGGGGGGRAGGRGAGAPVPTTNGPSAAAPTKSASASTRPNRSGSR